MTSTELVLLALLLILPYAIVVLGFAAMVGLILVGIRS